MRFFRSAKKHLFRILLQYCTFEDSSESAQRESAATYCKCLLTSLVTCYSSQAFQIIRNGSPCSRGCCCIKKKVKVIYTKEEKLIENKLETHLNHFKIFVVFMNKHPLQGDFCNTKLKLNYNVH